ncbi:MAG: GntR family transcriptional regulator [Paludibacter sp.]|nr:GntR family transcriptional regulator [Paludibacter sp.]
MDHQLEYYDLSFLAYKRIKEMILNNVLKPGDKIVQEKLAAELGVSRMPLHKAFQMLENELLVESVPRRGIFVSQFNLSEIKDAYECREAIEGVAARKAAEYINPEQISYLYSLFKPFESDLEKVDKLKYEEADKLFHKTLLELSNNKILQRMELFGNVITRTYQRGLTRTPQETYPEHISIIDAIATRNGDEAERLVRMHFRKTLARFLERH